MVNSQLEFSDEEIMVELSDHPERFSANVILRPVFQEMILPNIAFIGGGGEIAYWLELKKVFEATGVPFPVLILRNSFTIVEKNHAQLAAKLRLSNNDLFNPVTQLLVDLVKKESTLQ